MEPINRGKGVTPSEQYLANLGDQTFLDLWSYPNTFSDRKQGYKGSGKEICDLLVVCGDDVIIFSDKAIRWPGSGNINQDWSRWYRRAVEKSVDQIRGAERWLKLYPNRVFIDALCTSPIPVDIPPNDRIRIHGVCIVSGAQQACSQHFKDRDGSLMIHSTLRGDDHTNPATPGWLPFSFGDVAPNGSFVHVFDETALDVVMREMDTVLDFIAYLTARGNGIRHGPIGLATSEVDLVAIYAQTDLGGGRHGFPPITGQYAIENVRFSVPPGTYRSYRRLPEYKARAQANLVSYQWDNLIRSFTSNVVAGTSVAVAGQPTTTQGAERALRSMALETRTGRRALGQAFSGALCAGEASGQDRYARVVIHRDGCHDPEMGYVFLILAYRQEWLLSEGYTYYRDGRAGMLRAYCEVALFQNRHLKRMLGIAIDASEKITGRVGGSEDLMLVQIDNWTTEHESEIIRLSKEAEILLPERLKASGIRISEYPPVQSHSEYDDNNQAMKNRHERRKFARATRSAKSNAQKPNART